MSRTLEVIQAAPVAQQEIEHLIGLRNLYADEANRIIDRLMANGGLVEPGTHTAKLDFLPLGPARLIRLLIDGDGHTI